MSLWLYEKKWYLLASFIGFGVLFAATIHFDIEAGKNKPSGSDVYILLFYWWAALISLYAYWFADTMHGKSKDKSKLIKSLIIAFPAIFVLLAVFVSCKFIGNV
tara:strand:+ start:990 stop:1301 length:312 start_codon:yes stop_codon:yes gene_type:complete